MIEEQAWSRAYVLGEGEEPEQTVDRMMAWVRTIYWERKDTNAFHGPISYWYESGSALSNAADWYEWRDEGRKMLQSGEALRVRVEVVHPGQEAERMNAYLAV